MTKGFAIISFLFCLSFVNAQFPTDIHSQYKFRYVTIDNGLSDNTVYRICEDHHGYIWIATRMGLNRLSGTEVRNYYHNPNHPNTIPSQRIYVVFCDSRGILWIGTDDGLCTYNEGTDAFVQFENVALDKEMSFYDIIEDGKGNIWFGTEHGLFKYNTKNDELIGFDKHNNGLLSTGVYRILNCSDTLLWLSIYPKGLCSYNIRSDSIITYTGNNTDGYNINERRIERIFKDKRGDFWFGTYNDGAYKYNLSDSIFTRYSIDDKDPYSTRVRAFFEDNSGKFFVGTRAGLYSDSESNGKFYLYANSKHDFSRLSANSILCSFIDHTHGLWVGTIYGGVNYTNLEAKPFTAYTSRENNQYFLNNPSVFGMDEDKEGNIYVGTEGGVNILNRETSTFSFLTSDHGNKNSLSYNDVKSIAVTSNGDFWAGTNMGGLNFYSKRDKKFRVYRNIPGDTNSLPFDRIYNVMLDDNEDLYVLSNLDRENQPSTLSILRKGQKSFENYRNEFSNGIIEGPDGNIYIGAQFGFSKYDKKRKTFSFYQNKSLVGNTVSAIHFDRLGKIWIGSNKGLTRYSFETEKYISYENKIAYPANNVYGILSDSQDNIWISTNSGLYKLMGAVTKSIDSVTVRLFNKDDGLPSKEFSYNACFQNRNGEMFFGGINGFIRFKPEEITENRFKPRIVISDLIIDGNIVRQGDIIEGKVILNQSIDKTSKISLNHNIKSFTLKFDALYFANPGNNGFKYMLENFDSDWIIANNYNNSVTYANLPSGDYTFIIYATNNKVVLSNKPQILKIKILPPFWETWLFRIAALLSFIMVGYLIYWSRIQKFKIHERLLKDAVDKRTRQLNESNRELNAQKNEIIAQNEEIQTQNEELFKHRKLIEEKNDLLEEAVNNLNFIDEFGRQLTSNLNIEDIYKIIEQYLSSILKIDIIGFGVFDDNKNEIVFKYFGEKGKLIPRFSSSLDDPSSLAAYCYKNKHLIVLNDLENEYKSYISEIRIKSKGQPSSVAYFPLILREKIVGVFTVQSFEKDAFPDNEISIIQSLLSYITISVDNAINYELVKKQKEEIEQNQEHLEELVAERTKKLEIAKNRAEESDRLKSAFLANMSHEIRTPLNAIIGFVEILNAGEVDKDETINFYRIIKENGFTLLQLINDIIDLSKIEAGQFELIPMKIELHNLLTEVYNSFNERLKNNHDKDGLKLKLVNNFNHNNIILYTDRVRLVQILNNFISNAIKYTVKGTIEFGIKDFVSNDRIVLFVKDTGIGIEKKYHKHIFERFIKIDYTSTVYPGTGLGLAITKQLVEKMGGKIEMDSEPGVGSEFRCILPHTL